MIPEPHHLHPQLLQPPRPLPIIFPLSLPPMLPPIQLNHHPRLHTIEIQNKSPHRILPPPLPSRQRSASQYPPHLPLRVGSIFPHPPGKLQQPPIMIPHPRHAMIIFTKLIRDKPHLPVSPLRPPVPLSPSPGTLSLPPRPVLRERVGVRVPRKAPTAQTSSLPRTLLLQPPIDHPRRGKN